MRRIRLERCDSKLGPTSVAFGPNGELYAACRKPEAKKQSSAILISAFDRTGRELRHAEIKTTAIQLPQVASMFQVSRDGALLLYVETSLPTWADNDAYAAVLGTATLQPVSGRSFARGSSPSLRIFGFSTDGKSVLTASAAEERRTEGLPITRSVLVTRLDARNLQNVLDEQAIQNPFESSGYFLDPTGLPWFSDRNLGRETLHQYDPHQKKTLTQIRATNNAFGIGRLLFLEDSIVGFTDEANELGEIVRFERDKQDPVQTERVTGCGFIKVVASPDGRYSAAVCSAMSQSEWNAGAVTVCKALLVQSKTLRLLATIPLSKRARWLDVALWSGEGEVLLATTEPSGDVSLYSLKDQ